MPARPAPYAWVLAPFRPEDVENAVRGIARAHGFITTEHQADGSRVFILAAAAPVLVAAAERLKSDITTIDPPGDGERYRLTLRVMPPDDQDPRARLEVEPYDDNWAAWSVIGPLADGIARALGAREITADPPPWLQQEIDRPESAATGTLPLLVLRTPLVFPGFAALLSFGRPASVASVTRLIEQKAESVVLLLQRDPMLVELRGSSDEVFDVGLHARVLRCVRDDDGWKLIVKGIARVSLSSVDFASGLASVTTFAENRNRGGRFTSLREFARFDPLVGDKAGTTLLAALDEKPIGFVADLVAQALEDLDLAKRAYLECDAEDRGALVEAAVLALV